MTGLRIELVCAGLLKLTLSLNLRANTPGSAIASLLQSSGYCYARIPMPRAQTVIFKVCPVVSVIGSASTMAKRPS